MRNGGPILPGATLGVVGGGQLGRMFVQAAHRLGYRVHVLSPEAGPPAAQVADAHIRAEYGDETAVRDFARGVEAITYEFENIPADAMDLADAITPVRPAPRILRITQNRAREKRFLVDCGLPVGPFRIVSSLTELREALSELAAPVIVKTAESGYDGKGQAWIDCAEDAAGAWNSLGGVPGVCEKRLHLAAELSVVIARGTDGLATTYGPFANVHRNAILDSTVFPADLAPPIEAEALSLAVRVAEALGVVGVICVELFVLADGRVLVNEIAPRPHNSGHLTIDAHVSSQFEQQVRTVCGLPLGDASPRSAAAMVNLLGDAMGDWQPDKARAMQAPGLSIHLYGKDRPRRGRKMGHITALADTSAAALRRAEEARAALTAGRRARAGGGASDGDAAEPLPRILRVPRHKREGD